MHIRGVCYSDTHKLPLNFNYSKSTIKSLFILKAMVSIVCLPWLETSRSPVSSGAGAQEYIHSTGSGVPRKPLCEFGVSCLGQVLEGSPSSCSFMCSCVQNPTMLRGGSWQDTQGYLAEAPAAARRTSRCRNFLFLSGTPSCFELFGLHLCVSLLCHAQNNPRKSLEKELFSPFQNRKGIGKNLDV